MVRRPIPIDDKTSMRLSSVRSKGTSIERIFAAAMAQHGHTSSSEVKGLPGNPDFADMETKVAVFLDGCFWHGHPNCYREPKHNREYWQEKIRYNKKRRRQVKKELELSGWCVLRFWECEIKSRPDKVVKKVLKTIADRKASN